MNTNGKFEARHWKDPHCKDSVSIPCDTYEEAVKINDYWMELGYHVIIWHPYLDKIMKGE